MIFIIYLAIAAILVALSCKASEYVDLIDKKSSLSGAFIGGVLLSAVTSLPELFTSLSSALIFDLPGLCMGNILGSNLFNLAALAGIILIYFKPFQHAVIGKSHTTVAIFTLLIYATLALNLLGILNITIATINVTSIIILILYVMGIRLMSSDTKDVASENVEECTSSLTLKQVIIRFVFVAIGIIITSVILTYVTDIIATRYNIGSALAGALFLGITTSLPELASTVALFKLKSYSIAFGNIIGSNLFNFIILSITDVLYLGDGIYNFSDPKTVNLLLFGTLATPLFLMVANKTNRKLAFISQIGVLLCYVGFLSI